MSDGKPRILIIKLWALGDVVLATPLVPFLRAKYPDCHITWLADKANAGVLEGCDSIDDVISLDVMEWRRCYRRCTWPRFIAKTIDIRCQVRDNRFDMVLNLHADQWWATLLNVGDQKFGLFTKKKSIFRRFYTESIASTSRMHFTKHQLLMAHLLKCPEVVPQMTVGKLADEELFLRSFFEKNEIRLGAPLIVISPFSSNASKDWPPERFGELAVHVESRYSAQIVMTHAPSELERARKLTADSAARIVVASGTSLLEYVAILRAARLVVCNDTSALHIAAAAGTPVVAMFGPTSPAETEPLVGERRIVTPKDGSRSIEAITMQQVVEAVDELLNGATDQM